MTSSIALRGSGVNGHAGRCGCGRARDVGGWNGAHDNMRTPVYLPFQPQEQRSRCATASALNRSSTTSAHRCTSTARARSATPIARSTPRSPAIRTRFTTRSRRTRRWRSCACCERSAAAPTPTPAARSRWRCAPASRRARSCSPASARRATSWSSPSPGRRHDQRRIAGELDRIAALAAAAGRAARVALRVNPDIDAQSHPNISTGLQEQQVRRRAAGRARHLSRAPRRGGLRFVGVHMHIGSQITTRRAAAPRRRGIAGAGPELRDDGVPLEHVDLGGGLGIAYEGRPMITPAEYAAAVLPELRRAGCRSCSSRAGRSSAHSGALVARVVDVKQYPDGRRFAVLDAGMTELMRPALYGSFHRIVPVAPRGRPRRRRGTSSARSARAATSSRASGSCPTLEVDDLVAMLDTGAYGAVMALELQPPAAGAGSARRRRRWTVIRRRQTLDDVLALESR